MIFTQIGVWGFNENFTLPLRVYNLPIEEILFFICVPYACVFTYYCVKKYIPLRSYYFISTIAATIFIFSLLIVAFYNANRLYTSFTFLFLAAFVLLLLYRKATFLPHFVVSFVLILPFFFLSNGILTGSFISQPVVFYNDNHNLGIRMFTIPLEDTFYGMLLLLMNVSLYEYFLKKAGLARAE